MRTLLTADAVLGPAGRRLGNSVLVEDGTIVAVGEGLVAADALEVRHPGGTVLAGLVDSHIHPTAWAARRSGLDLSPAADLAGVVELVADRAERLPAGTAVVGFGLDEERLAEGRLPDRSLLDAVDRPVVLTRVCGHVAVANSAALDLAGIGPASPDPPGGMLDRDAAGVPDGVLRETAVGLLTAAVSVPDPDPADLLAALAGLVGSGITRIDAVASTGNPLWCGSGSELDVLLAVAADLPLDVGVFVVTSDPATLVAAADRIRRSRGRLTFRGWKGFADGSLGARTAALAAPYADDPGNRGVLRADPAELVPLLAALDGLDGTAAVHAIGDAAAAATLDVVDDAARLGLDVPVRLEHASVLSPALVRRLAAAGVAASVQPGFVTADEPWIARRLGPRRAEWAYPFRSLLAAGVPLVGGSDAPVTDPDPWAAMAAARERSGGEALPPADALALYADGLAAGSAADLVVVDRDPRATRPVVVSVWQGGVPVPRRGP